MRACQDFRHCICIHNYVYYNNIIHVHVHACTGMCMYIVYLYDIVVLVVLLSFSTIDGGGARQMALRLE